MNLISLLVFIPLQLIFLPLALVGIFLVAYKQIVVSKRLGSSQTAVEALNGRWTMHVFDMRKDDAAVKLAKVLPNNSTLGLWLVLFPLWVKYKISQRYFAYPRLPKQGEENIADLFIARSIYFDTIIARAVEDVEQFVVLGGGYDTRSYGEIRQRNLNIFELDQPDTQHMKIQWLKQAGIDASHVKFVAVDFSRQDVFHQLKDAGYDADKKTLFLWEGVTLYLAEDDVRKMLKGIRAHSPTGSTLVADFYGEKFLQIGKNKAGKTTLDYTNEGLNFGLAFGANFESVLDNFVNSENLITGETWFMGSVAEDGPFMVVAEISV